MPHGYIGENRAERDSIKTTTQQKQCNTKPPCNKPNILTNILDVIITSSINNKDWIHNTNFYPIHLWLEARGAV